MNKLLKSGLALLMGIFAATGASAQMQELPVDSAVRVGTLPNGLTYYIRHNETPKGQADFYIAQKVGSILEEDNQRGLAHFLEHMCFNGTTNFPDKGIINWLESIGVKFGYNLNAQTGVDATIYNISAVPVDRKSLQDSCLLILHDWACDLTLDPKEIDAERGVIHEEWRRSMQGQMRIMEEQLPKMYPGSKYGYRLPIGTMEVVDNFPPQAIIDYYHTWYRPDQQGIVVVGDIDPDYIEGKIKEMFSSIKMPENAKERVYEPVPDNQGTIYAIGKDKEMSAPVALMFFKTDVMCPREARNTPAYYAVKYMTDVVEQMLNVRLSDLSKKADSPFAQGSVGFGDFFLAKTKEALTLEAVGKDGKILPALDAVYREVLRARNGGFTPGEFERANAEIRSQYDRLYNERNNTRTEAYSREYVNSFLEGEPIPGIEMEKQIMDMMTQQVPLQAINQLLPQLITDDNRVVLMMLPDAEGFHVPTEAEVAASLAAVDKETLEPYRDEMRTDPLIPNLPAPGKITGEIHNAQWDATEFTLSNGLKVIVKPTTFKDNEILFMASAKGGLSVVGDEQASSVIFMPYALDSRGLGAYTNSDIQKYLQGKQVNVNVNFDSYSRSVSGSTTKADLPTLMELIYATFTEFNFNADEFAARQNMLTGVLANQESTPEFYFGKLALSKSYAAAGKQMITSAHVKAADHAATTVIVKDMLDCANDFTFYFVGSIDMATFKPLLEQYIATLPTGKSNVAYAYNAGHEVTLGKQAVEEVMEMATPQTWAYYIISGKVPYTAKNRVMSSMIGQIMSKRLLDKVREEMGATYSIGAQSSLTRMSENNFELEIAFPMKPEMRNEVSKAIDVIIEEMGQNVTETELAPVKEYMIKTAKQQLEENNAWLSAMNGANLNGVDVFNGQADVVNSVTIADLQNFWNEIRGLGNATTVVLNPKE